MSPVRFRPKTRQLRFTWMWAYTPSIKGSKLLFPVIKAVFKKKRDQTLRLLCLKGQVRARGSTLWRHRWQEASEFLCTKTPLLEGVEQPKENPEKALSDMLLMHVFAASRSLFRHAINMRPALVVCGTQTQSADIVLFRANLPNIQI